MLMAKDKPGRPGPNPEDMPDTFEGRVAANVIRIRRRRGWTVAQLAEESGIKPLTWYRIESGKWPNTCRLHLDKVAQALGVKVETLCKETS